MERQQGGKFMTKQKKIKTQDLVLLGVLTAIIFVLQFFARSISIGVFSITLVSVPIIVGACLIGSYAGAWLGFVFGLVVILSGDAQAFWVINIPGTIITVMLKGIACGYLAGLTYNIFKKRSRYLSVSVSAIVCAVVNTGVFLLGCFVFFFDTVKLWADGANTFYYMIISLVGLNFVIELLINIVLTPVIVRIIDISKRLFK